MAKQNSTPAAVNCKDVPKEAVARAQAAMAGGRQDPLTPPSDAKVSEDQKGGKTYTRWTEHVTIVSATRAPSKSGLLEFLVVAKLRQSSKENTGRKVYSRYYWNVGSDVSEGHEKMNDRTIGALTSLLSAASLMPSTGGLKGTLLDKMFPLKNQPNTASPLAGKAVMANIAQEEGPAKDPKTGKAKLDAEGEPILEKRDRAESFLPDTDASGDDEEEE